MGKTCGACCQDKYKIEEALKDPAANLEATN